MRETSQQRVERLCKDDRGRALLSLLIEHGNIASLAQFCSVSAEVAKSWIERGFISTRGAEKIAERTGRMREEFRPDLTAAQWEKPRGPDFGVSSKDQEWSGDSKLLVDTARLHGGTTKFCRKAGISVGNFHTWKSRNRIPAIKLPIIISLSKPRSIDRDAS